ncbi:MAG: FG-GAP-like repeat-containing protein [Bacteroidota bacterium]
MKRINLIVSFLLLSVFIVSLAHSQTKNFSGEDSTIFVSHGIYVPQKPYRSGKENWAVVIADMNKDGHLDLVSASKPDGSIHIHLNDQRGIFPSKKAYQAPTGLRAAISLDVNQDGFEDILSCTMNGQLVCLLNDTRGGLQSAKVFSTGQMAHSLLASDLNQDGKEDILIVSTKENKVYTHINQGRGNFSIGEIFETGPDPRSIACGDIDGDGLDDLVIGGDHGYLYLHKRLGPSLFASLRKLRSTQDIWSLALGDLNGDGMLDIAAASYVGTDLFIHLNQGDGNFQREIELESGQHNFDLILADLDRDKDLDIVTCSNVDNSLNFHLNKGKGEFAPMVQRKTGKWSVALAAGDLDKDGDPDLVTGSVDDGMLNVHANRIVEIEQPLRTRKYTIRGKIYDKKSGRMLTGVNVSLKNSDDKSLDILFSDSKGGYEFELSPNTSYKLAVRTEGYPFYKEDFRIEEANLEKDVYLEKPQLAYIYGKVRDRKTNYPVDRARVSLFKDGDQIGKTITVGLKGDYRFNRVAVDNNYEIRAIAEGYEDELQWASLSTQDIGKGRKVDLFMRKEVKGRCVYGKVIDQKTGKEIPKAGLIFKNDFGQTLAKFRADQGGNYRTCLPYGHYEVTAVAKGYFYKVSDFDLAEKDGKEDLNFDIMLKPLEKDSFVLLNVYFDYNDSTLRVESEDELLRALRVMKQNPQIVMEIGGHTSSEGHASYNQRLSQGRANAVYSYLLANGISRRRLVSKGYGEDRRVVLYDNTESKREKNRRTEFKVLRIQEARTRSNR